MNKCKCGKPAVEGKKSCQACLEKGRKHYYRKKARNEARKQAFASKDTEYVAKRKYTKRADITSVQMAGAVYDLESFISKLGSMSAADYLEARESLIRSIIRRGGKNGNTG